MIFGSCLGIVNRLTNATDNQRIGCRKCGYGKFFHTCFNPFVPNAPFLCPLKTSQNRKVFFRG